MIYLWNSEESCRFAAGFLDPRIADQGELDHEVKKLIESRFTHLAVSGTGTEKRTRISLPPSLTSKSLLIVSEVL
jgi:hypothetical protein